MLWLTEGYVTTSPARQNDTGTDSDTEAAAEAGSEGDAGGDHVERCLAELDSERY